MKKYEAKREGDKLIVYVACGYRWEETDNPQKEDIEEFADEEAAIEYAKNLDLSIGFQAHVEEHTFVAEDFEDDEELLLRDAFETEVIFCGDENDGKDVEGAILIEWSYEKHPGYARNLLNIGVGGEHPFQNLRTESDLITGNEESTFRSNYSVLLTKEELMVCGNPDELYLLIEEELNKGHWKWNYFKNNPSSQRIKEQIKEIINTI